MNPIFFQSNDYFIDEKVNLFKFENCYRVYNEKGEIIGSINQKLSVSQKLLRLILNKAMLPFRLEIRDSNETLQTSINRGWTFFMSKITIQDAENQSIGIINQKFKLFKPTFQIADTSGQHIAEISGDWKGWNFLIKNSSSAQIGTISKKWAGAMKEIFTTADKYNVHIDTQLTSNLVKAIIISSAITIDMVLKERK